MTALPSKPPYFGITWDVPQRGGHHEKEPLRESKIFRRLIFNRTRIRLVAPEAQRINNNRPCPVRYDFPSLRRQQLETDPFAGIAVRREISAAALNIEFQSTVNRRSQVGTDGNPHPRVIYGSDIPIRRSRVDRTALISFQQLRARDGFRRFRELRQLQPSVSRSLDVLNRSSPQCSVGVTMDRKISPSTSEFGDLVIEFRLDNIPRDYTSHFELLKRRANMPVLPGKVTSCTFNAFTLEVFRRFFNRPHLGRWLLWEIAGVGFMRMLDSLHEIIGTEQENLWVSLCRPAETSLSIRLGAAQPPVSGIHPKKLMIETLWTVFMLHRGLNHLWYWMPPLLVWRPAQFGGILLEFQDEVGDEMLRGLTTVFERCGMRFGETRPVVDGVPLAVYFRTCAEAIAAANTSKMRRVDRAYYQSWLIAARVFDLMMEDDPLAVTMDKHVYPIEVVPGTSNEPAAPAARPRAASLPGRLDNLRLKSPHSDDFPRHSESRNTQRSPASENFPPADSPVNNAGTADPIEEGEKRRQSTHLALACETPADFPRRPEVPVDDALNICFPNIRPSGPHLGCYKDEFPRAVVEDNRRAFRQMPASSLSLSPGDVPLPRLFSTAMEMDGPDDTAAVTDDDRRPAVEGMRQLKVNEDSLRRSTRDGRRRRLQWFRLIRTIMQQLEVQSGASEMSAALSLDSLKGPPCGGGYCSSKACGGTLDEDSDCPFDSEKQAHEETLENEFQYSLRYGERLYNRSACSFRVQRRQDDGKVLISFGINAAWATHFRANELINRILCRITKMMDEMQLASPEIGRLFTWYHFPAVKQAFYVPEAEGHEVQQWTENAVVDQALLASKHIWPCGKRTDHGKKKSRRRHHH